MSAPPTTFDKPEWDIVPDTQVRRYANVDNQVYFHSPGKTTVHPIVVPTGLFTFMREVLKVEPEEEVSLYLIRDGDYIVFGIAWGESDSNVADLWAYTKPPVWLKLARPA